MAARRAFIVLKWSSKARRRAGPTPGTPPYQRGGHCLARVALAVEGDGKAVGLLLNPPNEGEEGLLLSEPDLPPVRGNQGAGPVAAVLHHAEHRHLQPELGEHRDRHIDLPLPAVHQDQIGQDGELLVPVQVAAKAAGEHLLHGGVVVRWSISRSLKRR